MYLHFYFQQEVSRSEASEKVVVGVLSSQYTQVCNAVKYGHALLEVMNLTASTRGL
jgi:hypothetical protein